MFEIKKKYWKYIEIIKIEITNYKIIKNNIFIENEILSKILKYVKMEESVCHYFEHESSGIVFNAFIRIAL